MHAASRPLRIVSGGASWRSTIQPPSGIASAAPGIPGHGDERHLLAPRDGRPHSPEKAGGPIPLTAIDQRLHRRGKGQIVNRQRQYQHVRRRQQRIVFVQVPLGAAVPFPAIAAAVAGPGVEPKAIDPIHLRAGPHPLQESADQPGGGPVLMRGTVDKQHPFSRGGCVPRSIRRQADHRSFESCGADSPPRW